jgi:uncharacterized membrane protein YeiH
MPPCTIIVGQHFVRRERALVPRGSRPQTATSRIVAQIRAGLPERVREWLRPNVVAIEIPHCDPVQLFDAVGLGLFAVTGAQKALSFGLGPSGAILLGMLSGIGGGIARDLLVAEFPNVLRREFYAVAALLGAACVVVGDAVGLPATPTAIGGAVLCFVLRYVAIRRNWQLPVARADEDG